MRSVSRFESNLLRILHSFLDQSDVSHVLPAIKRPEKRPPCLSRDAVELVKQSLSNGSVTLLAREGGWARQKHLRDDQIREGSLWQRTDPSELGLDFSAASLDFLIWITAADATNEMPLWVTQNRQPLTVGDQFLLSLAARSLRNTTILSQWYRHGLFQRNGLIGLFLPEQFAAVESVPTPDFEPWMSGSGSSVLEALQDALGKNCIAIERGKKRIKDTFAMLRLGQAQEVVLEALFDAAESSGRRDLCRFLMDAAAELLAGHSRASDWIGSLQTTGLRVADRTKIYQSATAVLRATDRLRRWHRAGQAIGFFDEGYAESQWFKSTWESNTMDEVMEHADRVTGELSF